MTNMTDHNAAMEWATSYPGAQSPRARNLAACYVELAMQLEACVVLQQEVERLRAGNRKLMDRVNELNAKLEIYQ